MTDLDAWNYLTVEDPTAHTVRLEARNGWAPWGLRKHMKDGHVRGITIVSADGLEAGILHHTCYHGNHFLEGELLRREDAQGKFQPEGVVIKLYLPVNGLNENGRRRLGAREMLPLYLGDKPKEPTFQYHVLLGSNKSESPPFP